MTYQRLAYDDADTTRTMVDDCTACGSQLRLPTPLDPSTAAPSLRWDDFPREVPKRDLEVSAAAAHLASRLHLHLD